jgi:hypothetical protein
MKIKFITYIILLICVLTNLNAQNVFIKVEGENLKNQNVRLSCIDDRISLLEQTLYSANLDEVTTSTEINISLSEKKEVALKVGLREYHFLAVPGNTYTINILPFDTNEVSFAYKEILPIKFGMQKDDNINLPLEYIDSTYDSFLTENFRNLYLKDSLSIENLNKLEKDLLLKYTTNDYATNYIKYEFASLRYALTIGNRKKLISKMFQSSPVLYDNIGYMDCFSSVFSHYFSQGYKFISTADLEKWLDANNYSALNDALGRDEVLQNEIVRELVFLQGMKDAFWDGTFNSDRILKMLEKFVNTTKFPQHKQIAGNLIQYLRNKDFKGKKLPTLQVKNIDGEETNLEKFMDKTLLLCLVQLDRVACLKELETVHYYYDSIKENCNVVVVCFDNSFEKMYNFVKNSKVGNKYKFPFLYFNNNWQIVEELNLHFFPTFVLINKDGTIKRNPFDSPSSGSLIQFTNKK